MWKLINSCLYMPYRLVVCLHVYWLFAISMQVFKSFKGSFEVMELRMIFFCDIIFRCYLDVSFAESRCGDRWRVSIFRGWLCRGFCSIYVCVKPTYIRVNFAPLPVLKFVWVNIHSVYVCFR